VLLAALLGARYVFGAEISLYDIFSAPVIMFLVDNFSFLSNTNFANNTIDEYHMATITQIIKNTIPLMSIYTYIYHNI
jgi:hypothetical protein